MHAIILAAGEGRRLRPLTAHRPKVMIPVGGRPLLSHVIEALVANRVTDITIVVGYHKERIQTTFQDGGDHGATIRYAVQDAQLGTGHALRIGLDAAQAAGLSGPFLVLPGDNWVTAALVKALCDAPGEAALITTRSPTPSKYGVVEGEATIKAIVEKPLAPKTRVISTGIYRLDDDIRRYIDTDDGLALTDAINHFIEAGGKVTPVQTSNAWQDIVYPWDLLQLNHRVLDHLASLGQIDGSGQVLGQTETGVTLHGPCHIGQATIIRQGCQFIGPVWIGENCDIGPNVVIRGPASIGDHVRIGPFTDLENVILHDGVSIDTGGVIRHTVIDTGARLGPRVSTDKGPCIFDLEENGTFQRIDSLGAVIGQDAVIGANTVLEPGAVIGSRASIAPNRVAHRVPDQAQVL